MRSSGVAPLARKLGIKPGLGPCVIGAPEGYRANLGALPDRVSLHDVAEGSLDMVHAQARHICQEKA